jgi:hypothetical protein
MGCEKQSSCAISRRMIKIIIICLALLIPSSSFADDYVGVQASKHMWGSKRLNTTLWGIARADLDGNGTRETVLLERDRIWQATQQGNELKEVASFKFPAYTQGLRIFVMDVDANGTDDLVISAVQYGQPASMIITKTSDGFSTLIKGAKWHLRVVEKQEMRDERRLPAVGSVAGETKDEGRRANDGKILIGQHWSRDNFFTGKLYELKLDNGKLNVVQKLARPDWADIFNYTSVPTPTENPILVSLKGYAPLRAYEEYAKKNKKKWKKFWTSNGRFGGTILYVHRDVRQPLADMPVYNVPVGHEPITLFIKGKAGMLALINDMPLKNVIGKKTLIRGGRLVGFEYNDALGFQEAFLTERMPGFIADYVVDRDADGTKLYIALQGEPEVFSPNPQSSVLIYKLPGYNVAPLAQDHEQEKDKESTD